LELQRVWSSAIGEEQVTILDADKLRRRAGIDTDKSLRCTGGTDDAQPLSIARTYDPVLRVDRADPLTGETTQGDRITGQTPGVAAVGSPTKRYVVRTRPR